MTAANGERDNVCCFVFRNGEFEFDSLCGVSCLSVALGGNLDLLKWTDFCSVG